MGGVTTTTLWLIIRLPSHYHIYFDTLIGEDYRKGEKTSGSEYTQLLVDG